MLLATTIEPFDWKRILISDEAPVLFLLEIAFRCLVTYLLILGALRVTGRRGVRQLSIFELSIILALGSAAGDAMFYDDVPLLHVAVVFVMVTGLYLVFNRLTEHYPRFSDWLEGAPVLLIEDGEIKHEILKKQNLTQKELFGELRQYQVEHLGQVRRAYIEATGNVSIYFFADDQVRPGLPIWPERFGETRRRPEEAGPQACACCGHVQELPRGGTARCEVCQQEAWVPACAEKRIQ
ncbi:uncharacterized membrane protein YcaP (DUF421 family) [Hymenobacter luteus]|uniref:Uncharacterized membrane protein YcaP (DUF421 family) n=2 Tax=Hymenobacter TaxID=89966 RepID=A0A7W9SXJ9_9BACT|nr:MULTISPECIES: DUF421 domain-containing protein [Hymenobacter]MBB4600450.1 uncharacterized membrane protein YcaP (DUF421 family) [Hymenobacter latericoloratus]MBB6057240.1 uncharacterized membrane protein YcaP (DUF421 family) [Hymenobacter luteus]